MCNKTRKLIGLFYRTFYKHSSSETMLKLYSTFIRPHLEYAAAAWDPFLKKDIDLLEDVQTFALKVCIKSWNRNYEELLSMTHLSTLQSRRQKFKLCHIFNIINDFTFFPEAPIQRRVLPYSSRSVHNQALVPIHAKTSQFQASFFPSAIDHWNHLPASVSSAPSVSSFKYHLNNPIV